MRHNNRRPNPQPEQHTNGNGHNDASSQGIPVHGVTKLQASDGEFPGYVILLGIDPSFYIVQARVSSRVEDAATHMSGPHVYFMPAAGGEDEDDGEFIDVSGVPPDDSDTPSPSPPPAHNHESHMP